MVFVPTAATIDTPINSILHPTSNIERNKMALFGDVTVYGDEVSKQSHFQCCPSVARDEIKIFRSPIFIGHMLYCNMHHL